MKFDLLSKNTLILIDEVIKNDKLVRLIDQNKIRHDNVIHAGRLVNSKIFPTPFTGEVPQKQQVNLRIFFPNGTLDNRVVLDSTIVFQVVMHKDLWLIKDIDGEQVVRPYAIMDEIIKLFQDRSIGTLGVLHFKEYNYHALDKDYGVYNLEAKMMTI